MKNGIWITIPFSLLAAAATVSAPAVKSENGAEQKIQANNGDQEASTLIGSLKLGTVPTFDNALPCYAR